LKSFGDAQILLGLLFIFAA